MKKLLSIGVALIMISLLSCQKDKGIVNNATTKATSTGVTDQTPNIKTVSFVWHINSFFSNGEDITSRFADYAFDIQAPQLMTGVYNIVAVLGGNRYIGDWEKASYNNVIIRFPDPSSLPQSDVLLTLNLLNNVWTLKNNQIFDLGLQTNTMRLSFHTNGEIWPPNE
jgi:hypothetical protein